MSEAMLLRSFNLLATAPGGVARLRELILTFAVQGKLVPQDPNDKSADALLARSRKERQDAIANGKAKKEKPAEEVRETEEPFLLPKGWSWGRLTDTGEYVNGLAFKPSDWSAFGRPIIRIQNLSGRSRDFNRTNLDVDHSVVVRQGDILVSWSATLDAYIWNGEEGVLNQHIFRVWPSSLVEKRFLFWLLKWAIRDLAASDHAHGLVMTHINRGPFLAKPVGIPPLREQERIADRIEELMRLCDGLEEKGSLAEEQHTRLISTLFDALANSESAHALAENWRLVAEHFDLLLDRPEAVDALEQTILQLAVRGLLVPQDPKDEPASELLKKIRAEKDRLNAKGKINRDKLLLTVSGEDRPLGLPMGWAWASLFDVALSGPTNGLSPKPQETATNVRCLSLSATTQGFFKPECFKYVDIESEVANQYLLKTGDLLIQRGNSLDYVGIAAIYDGPDDAYIYPDLMMRLRLTNYVNLSFIHMALISVEGRRYFKSNATGTQGTMPKVNQATVAGAPIPLPPLDEQKRIVERVTALRRVCAELRKSLAGSRSAQSRLADALVAEVA